MSLFASNFLLSLCFTLNLTAQEPDIAKGKSLFNANCASCHKLNKKLIGPALKGVSAKYEKEWLYSWIKNSAAMIKSGDERAVAIYEEYNKVAMNSFTQLSNEDIDNILAYTDYVPPKPEAPVSGAPVGENMGSSPVNDIVLVLLSFILIVLIVLLLLINKTLKNLIPESDNLDKNKIDPKRIPIWKAFVQNQFLVLVSVVVLLLSSAYFAYGYMLQIGVDQGYMPIQPIHYSHKIHSGDNQIECQYCHSSAKKI
jgi:mono/diheme cytochrome c family protein